MQVVLVPEASRCFRSLLDFVCVYAGQQFFQGFHMTAILPSTIPIDGRPSGEAYVQFSDVNEAWRALQTRNGARMDRRYIELFPASKQEMTFAAQGGDPRGQCKRTVS